MSRSIIIDSLWCIALCVFIFMSVGTVPLHGDESTLIFMGRDFYYHMQGDTEQIFYRDEDSLSGDEATEQMLRLLNGTLPKYLYGAGAYFSGYTLDEVNQQWVWGAGWQWNHDNGHVPERDLLLTTRYISTGLLTLSMITLFAIGYAINGRLVAYVASGYYALNPAILINGRRAMMESSMLLFTLLAILIALLLLKNRYRWQYILLGVFSGLAVASKHTSVVTIASIFLASGLYFMIMAYRDRKRPIDILYLFGAGILSISIFFALNPAWWSNPLGVAGAVLEERQELLTGQIETFGSYETTQAQLAGFGRQAFVVLPMYAEVEFDGFISEQWALIQQYDSSIWSGVSLGGTAIGGFVVAVLMLIGAIRLWLSETIEMPHALLISVWSVAIVLLALLTPLEWQRYYLPIYPVVGILMALGLKFIFTSLQQQIVS